MRKLILRILRRLRYESRKLQHRLWNRLEWCNVLAPWQSAPYDLNESERVFPGAPSRLPYASADAAWQWRASSAVASASALETHRLRILSQDAYDISLGHATLTPELRALAAELPAAIVNAYRPIAWHTDFRTGYTWPKDILFFDARLAPRPGTDIKTPWELSRFVHVGLLAHCTHEVGGHEFLMQVLDWISDNPRFSGVNWASELVVALRAINWVWGLQLFRPLANRYPQVKQCIAESLYDHYLYLQRNLAYHEIYSDDHYLGDLVGLVYICAAFPEFPEADRWLLFAILGMEEEMRRQVLDDGYSHMMSSHYHRFVAELFVSGASLIERLPPPRRKRLNMAKPASAWPQVRYTQGQPFGFDGRLLTEKFYEKLVKMAEVTAVLTKPNGLVPQLGDNDSARVHLFFDSVAADTRSQAHLLASIALLTGAASVDGGHTNGYAEAEIIAGELSVRRSLTKLSCQFADGVVHFVESGIGVIRRGPFHLTVTCSPNGYGDGKGGHGHNDKLSFELNVNGTDFFVDGGCPYYTSDPELRNAFRSSKAHNTVVVAGMEQDPLPANLFALPQRCAIELKRDGEWGFSGYHTGYGTPHHRRFEVFEDRIVFRDTLANIGKRYLCFNLDPAVTAVLEEGQERGSIDAKLLSGSGVKLSLSISGVADAHEHDGFFGVGFGQVVRNSQLRFEIVGDEVETVLRII
jgi:hypothetical protein